MIQYPTNIDEHATRGKAIPYTHDHVSSLSNGYADLCEKNIR